LQRHVMRSAIETKAGLCSSAKAGSSSVCAIALVSLADDSADDRGGPEPRHPGEVDRGLCMPWTAQNSAFLRAQRHDVAGAREVACNQIRDRRVGA
jgi:hypothetical protein